MSLNPESFVPEQRKDIPEIGSQEAGEMLRGQIKGIADYIKSGSLKHKKSSFSMTPSHHLLFTLSSEPNGRVFDLWHEFQTEKGALQATALGIMREYGLDEERSILVFKDERIEKRTYPSTTIDRLAFHRALETTDKGEPTSVIWDVFDKDQLLSETPIPEDLPMFPDLKPASNGLSWGQS